MEAISNNDKIKDYVINNLAKRKNIQKINDCDDLIVLGVVDSLGVMQLVSFLEETFFIHVEDVDVVPNNFQSISSISLYVKSKL